MNPDLKPFHNAPDITFTDIMLSIKGFLKEEKNVLNKLSGSFPSGSLIGILGPSGAGKSSLLNILSGWDTRGKMCGRIFINGNPRNEKQFRKISSYVTQDCYLNDMLTVQENLTYAADFKLGRKVSNDYKLDLIHDILDKFGLFSNRYTRTKYLSGGQRKRLSICLELIHKPDIIFCDEPTTGLDIVSTLQCVKYLKQLTMQGKTVICTMHQPTDQVYNMFDIVYIVARGRCIYQGGSKEIINFLQHAAMPCGIFHSPLDYVLEIANEDYGHHARDALLTLSENGKNLDYFPICRKLENPTTTNLVGLVTLDNNNDNGQQIYSPMSGDVKKSFQDDWYEFQTLFKRELIKSKRNLTLTYLRPLSLIFCSVMVGTVCYGIGGNASMMFFNYNMVLIHLANYVIGSNLLTAMQFSVHRKVIENEYLNGYYGVRNYFVIYTLLDIPTIIISVICGSFLVYWLSGQLMTWMRLSMFILMTFQVAMVSSCLGTIFGTLFSFTAAVFTVMWWNMATMALCGYGLHMKHIPSNFYFLTHFAYIRYAVRSTMAVVFGYDHPLNECPEEEFYCSYMDAKVFLDDVGLEDFYFVYDSVALLLFYVIFKILCYVLLQYRVNERK